MNKVLENLSVRMTNLAAERERLNEATDKMVELRAELHTRDSFAELTLQEIEVEQELINQKYSDLLLELNTRLSYRELKKIWEITDGPLI